MSRLSGKWTPSRADAPGKIVATTISMRTNKAKGHAPAVTVSTNIAGDVSVPIDLPGVNAGRRVRSMALPNNLFNPFRSGWVCSKIDEISPSQFAAQQRDTVAASERGQLPSLPFSSAAMARDVLASIKREVHNALYEWTLQTSLRESRILRKHGCSRYASIPDHPSAMRPGSRPSSALTVLRPFSALQCLRRASSSIPPRPGASARSHDIDGRRSDPDRLGAQENTRPRSAVSRLGASSHAIWAHHDREPVNLQPNRLLSASGKMGGRVSGEYFNGRRRGSQGRNIRNESSTRSLTLEQHCDTTSSNVERVDDVHEEVYEDLDGEHDDELDNQISIMESIFSRVRRERPASAVVGHNLPRRNWVPSVPRSAKGQPSTVPPRSLIAVAQETFERADDKRETAGWWSPHEFGRKRPTSAPEDGCLSESHRDPDPMEAVNARRMRLYTSSAGSRGLRLLAAGTPVNQYGGASGAGSPQQGLQPKHQATGDDKRVTTAVPSWDRGASGGGARPLSSAAAAEVKGGDVFEREGHHSVAGSRPSSAAFRRWIETRPSARSAVSAVSSARTIGLDDPELLHLQLEMESRRGRTSDATLARMEDHYSAVVRKTSDGVSESQEAPRGKRGRSKSPRRKRRGRTKRATRRSNKGSSKGATGGGTVGGKRKKTLTPSQRKSSPNSRRGEGGRRGGEEAASAPRKAYPSAKAFMAEHFPTEDDDQGVSLLGMEQEQECRHVSTALSRAGVWVSNEVLRRALVIPTDRPLEACLAGLPLPMERLQDSLSPPQSGVGGVMLQPKLPQQRTKHVRSPVIKGARRLVMGAGERAGAKTR